MISDNGTVIKTTMTKSGARKAHTDRLGSVGHPSMPLAMLGQGETRQVISIRGKDDTKRFLTNLGFADGAKVTLISEMGGNVIVNVKGTRVAISRAMASRVLVG